MKNSLKNLDINVNNYIENLDELQNNDAVFNDDIISEYLKEIEKIPLLTVEEEKNLFIKLLSGDMKARNRLIEANLYLVIKVAKKLINRKVCISDLIEEGNIALIDAIKTFNVNSDLDFFTYAEPLIYAHIYNSIFKEQIYNVSIDTLDEDNELFCDDSLLEENIAIKLDFLTVKSMFDVLNEKEIFVLINHFGLNNVKIKSLEAIGNYLNIKRETVRQIEIRALKKIRSEFKKQKLKAIKHDKIFIKRKKKRKTIVRRFVYKGQNEEL